MIIRKMHTRKGVHFILCKLYYVKKTHALMNRMPKHFGPQCEAMVQPAMV